MKHDGLWKEGKLNLDEEDVEIMESDLGQFGLFAGQQVPLDFPMMIDENLDEAKKKKKKRKILQLESQPRTLAEERNTKFLSVIQKRVRSRKLLMVTPKVVSRVIGTTPKHVSHLLHDIIAKTRKTEPKQDTGLVEHTKILERTFRGDFGNGCYYKR